jgi:hypothetical protein
MNAAPRGSGAAIALGGTNDMGVGLVHAAAAMLSVAWAVEMHTKRSFEAFPQMTGSSSERTFIPGAANDRSPPIM